MDTDNLIYLVIVIIIAIVNAIAQGKKKKALAAKKAAALSAAPPTDEFEPISDPMTSLKDDPLKFLFDKELFADDVEPVEHHAIHQEHSVEENVRVPSPEHEKPEYTFHDEYADEMSRLEAMYSTGYQSILDESKIESILTPIDSEKDSPLEASRSESKFQETFQEEFDIRKAIIYSEIITPKYFPIHSKIDD